MAQLLDLPSELFTIIFFLLDNIDDALHFACTCKFINAIFDAPGPSLEYFHLRHCKYTHIEYGLPRRMEGLTECHVAKRRPSQI